MTTPVIDLVDVSRTFPGEPPVEAVRSVYLRIDPGEYLAIVGPSGSGKSTLLTLLGLLDRATSGRYRFEGVDVTNLPDSSWAAIRANRIGFVFQSYHLLGYRSALENVELGLLYRGKSDRAAAVEALDTVGLSHRTRFPPAKLSGGEQQRVAIARAVVGRPAVLLCDEPTGNLDSGTSGEILDLFERLWRLGITIVVISHDPAVAARAPRVVRIQDGRAFA